MERQPNNPDQLTIVSTQEALELYDADQLRDLRSYLFRTAQANLDMAYQITDVLVADDEEPKSRRKRITGLGDVA